MKIRLKVKDKFTNQQFQKMDKNIQISRTRLFRCLAEAPNQIHIYVTEAKKITIFAAKQTVITVKWIMSLNLYDQEKVSLSSIGIVMNSPSLAQSLIHPM